MASFRPGRTFDHHAEKLSSLHDQMHSAQAIERLHEDEDFQQDAKDPSIEPALDIMRADPQAMERYEGDARLMRVLHKLRSFQVRS